MTPAQERQLQLELADLRNEVNANYQLIETLEKRMKPSSDIQLEKAEADLAKTRLETEAAALRMEAERFKLEREKKEAAECDKAAEITPKVFFAALFGCVVLGFGGVVAKLG